MFMEFINFLKNFYIFVHCARTRAFTPRKHYLFFVTFPARAIIKKVHELHVQIKNNGDLDTKII
jgi:hypothetical protein